MRKGCELRTDAGLLDDCAPGGGDTAAKEADLFQRRGGVDRYDRNICDNGVLRECGRSHLSKNINIIDW